MGRPDIEKMERDRDVEGLIKALEHEHVTVRFGAVAALVRIGEPAIEPLIQALKDKSPFARKYACMQGSQQ